MVTSFKINDDDILTDNRVVTQISGLQPADSVASTVTSGGSKRITSTIRSNRTIQLTGYITHDITGVKDDLYSNWLIGEPCYFTIISNGEAFTEKCIIQEIYINSNQPLVTYTIKIVCYTAFLYKEAITYEATNTELTVALDRNDIVQHNITISHLIQANETAFTVDFYGTTTVTLDGDYSGQTAVIDCSEQTCYIDGVNKFYLVTAWQDGKHSDSATIPANTTVSYKKMVRGVW